MIDPILAIQIIVIGASLLFAIAAAFALGWSLKNGQFENFQQGSLSIFGPDEPVGVTTDEFPNED
jgi:cbb3-type cytochrome oxidase maturation protein